MVIYMAAMSIVLVLLLGLATKVEDAKVSYHTKENNWIDGVFSMISFNIGAITSIAAGYIGMRIAVFTNSRTTIMAEQGYAPAFATAIKGGIVMGFGLTSLGLLSLLATIYLFRLNYDRDSYRPDGVAPYQALMQAIAPFGLGGSSIALFGRVGGGIFTKAADVGADLVGKVQQNIPEDDPRNPGVIADNVGDNVGDIAGMGSDLFGSFAEATCAALVVSASYIGIARGDLHEDMSLGGQVAYFPYLLFPLLITAIGILTCLLTSFLATHIRPPTEAEQIEPCLKLQLVVSTILNTIALAPACYAALPHEMDLPFIYMPSVVPADLLYSRKWWHVYLCIMAGLWSGLAIGFITQYYTSHAFSPTRKVAQACKFGAATNIIHGLALGYESCVVPCVCIALSIWLSIMLCGMYGVAMAALGILSTMAIGLTIDAYGPISDNAGGIAEMAGMGAQVRSRTDALDAAGNTTAAIGKGFAIGSAALVSVALFGAYQTNINITVVNILDPRVFFGIVVGAMLPYIFSAMTMKSVGTAAEAMVAEISRQFRDTPGLMTGEVDPDYKTCITIATNASLKEMIPPGALVVLSPLLCGIFLGPEALSGLLPSSMASGVMMAIASANTGGSWDNAKKFIEGGYMVGFGKGSDVHKAAVIGDTVGDPLKDTSGPALNILVKLMAIISVVFAPIFVPGSSISGLIFNRLVCDKIGGGGLCPPIISVGPVVPPEGVAWVS
jgi:inorganic pyrophosphatase